MNKTGKYPDTIYRVGTKAVIKDQQGRVLCVHDSGEEDMWSLPGGGLDHGDSVESGLARELSEELDYNDSFSMNYQGECIYYSHTIGAFVIYLIFKVELMGDYAPHAGVDAKEVTYLNSQDIEAYKDRQADIIKKYGFGQDIDIPMIKS